MKCLILAAGLGSRLRGSAESKPLADLCGTPLIEHVVMRAQAGGASAFVVATGYRAEPLEAFLAELGRRLGIGIEFARVADWTLANGHSVLAGAAKIDGEFILLMSDHILDPGIVRGLVEGEPAGDGVILAVDRNLSGPLLDIDDATKVAVDGAGRIVAIGKQIDRYDAIDTGAFRAGPGLVAAIEEAIAAGGAGSLSEGVQRLAGHGRARTRDVSAAQWIDVDEPGMLALAANLIAGERPAWPVA